MSGGNLILTRLDLAGAGPNADKVAQQIMERVRRNSLQLADRLARLGWEPLTGHMVGSPMPRPFAGTGSAAKIGAMPVPLALDVFWDVVGSLDFVWNYRKGPAPDLFGGVPIVQLDPLYVESADFLLYAVSEWHDRIEAGDLAPGGPFPLDLAPDALHKANISGGAPYCVLLPDAGPDPLFTGDGFAIPFTDYLRHALRWGGFPGLAAVAQTPAVIDRVAELTEGFEPF